MVQPRSNHHDSNDRLHCGLAVKIRTRSATLGLCVFPDSHQFKMTNAFLPQIQFPLSRATEERFSGNAICWHGHQLFSSKKPIFLNSLRGSWSCDIWRLDCDMTSETLSSELFPAGLVADLQNSHLKFVIGYQRGHFICSKGSYFQLFLKKWWRWCLNERWAALYLHFLYTWKAPW